MATKKLGNPPMGKWISATAVRLRKVGNEIVADIKKVAAPKGRAKNIAAGFYDEFGQFHPIRASYDYDSNRVEGEVGKKRKPRKKAKKVNRKPTKSQLKGKGRKR